MHLSFSLTRERLNSMAQDLVQRSFLICDEALKLSGMTVGQIDEVVLVGGTTKMPMVVEGVKSYFGKTPREDINPDEVVAVGAAIQAAALTRAPGGAGGLLATGAFHQGAEERDLHCFRPGSQSQELAPGPLPHGPVSVRAQLQEQVGLHPTGLRRGPTAQVTGQGQARVRQGIAGQLSQQRCRDACARGRLKSAGLTVDQVA